MQCALRKGAIRVRRRSRTDRNPEVIVQSKRTITWNSPFQIRRRSWVRVWQSKMGLHISAMKVGYCSVFITFWALDIILLRRMILFTER